MQVTSPDGDLMFSDPRKYAHGHNSHKQSPETRDVMYLYKTLFHNEVVSSMLSVEFQFCFLALEISKNIVFLI